MTCLTSQNPLRFKGRRRSTHFLSVDSEVEFHVRVYFSGLSEPQFPHMESGTELSLLELCLVVDCD